jgi:hypothetical protein
MRKETLRLQLPWTLFRKNDSNIDIPIGFLTAGPAHVRDPSEGSDRRRTPRNSDDNVFLQNMPSAAALDQSICNRWKYKYSN